MVKYAFYLGRIFERMGVRRFEPMVRKQQNVGKKATKTKVAVKEIQYRKINRAVDQHHAELCGGKPDQSQRRLTQARKLAADEMRIGISTVQRAQKWERENNGVRPTV